MTAEITVIIPTMAAGNRFHGIQRCLGSIRLASSKPVQIIAVINGNRYDRAVADWLEQQADVRVHYVAKGSLPLALLIGRTLVASPFYATLDDDDEYLPGALDRRMALAVARQADVIVTNSTRLEDGKQWPLEHDMGEVESRPLQTLLNQAWLNSGNALFRTDTVGVEFFLNPHPYAEWTWLGFQLAMAKLTIAGLAEATNLIHTTGGSLSQSQQYRDSFIPLFRRMLHMDPPADVRRILRKRLGAAFHDLAEYQRRKGKRNRAWSAHWRSLLLPGGLRYFAYTRKLFGAEPQTAA